jgi:hypothetical protein
MADIRNKRLNGNAPENPLLASRRVRFDHDRACKHRNRPKKSAHRRSGNQHQCAALHCSLGNSGMVRCE